MLNVPFGKGVTAVALPDSRLCPTCHQDLPTAAFYRNCAECKECKRNRSRQNRMAQARKIIAFERFVGILVDLAKATTETSPPRHRGGGPIAITAEATR